MTKAILLVAFGSSNIEGINNSIGLLEKDLLDELGNEYTILKAFTSKFMISSLKDKYNITIPHVTKALFNLGNDGYKEVIIQPLHMMKGKDHNYLQEIAEEYKYSFKKLLIGKSLLGFEGEELISESFRLAEAIEDELREQDILLAGHGSKESSNEPYYVLEKSLTIKSGRKFYMATLEGEKKIEHVIKELKDDKIDDVVIKPLFIIPGKHVLTDIKGEENSWINKLNSKGIKATVSGNSLLENKKVRQIFIDNIKEAIEQ